MRTALLVEGWKLRRSRVPLAATILMGVLLPAMGLGFYVAATTGGTGSLADKAAALLPAEGWAGYLGLVHQIAAVAVFLGAGVVVAWAFGREYVDNTFPSLFALAVSRGRIAGAKYAVLAIWLAALTLAIAIVTFGLGILGGVGPLDSDVIAGLWRLIGVAGGAGMLGLTMGYVASLGRGYLPAIGALAVIIAVAQVAVLFGTGGWFTFAVPGLLAIAGSEGAPTLTPTQLALAPTLTAVTVWLTVRWWQHAEVVPTLS